MHEYGYSLHGDQNSKLKKVERRNDAKENYNERPRLQNIVQRCTSCVERESCQNKRDRRTPKGRERKEKHEGEGDG